MARSVVECLSVMVVRSCCLLNAAHYFQSLMLDLVPFDVTVSSNLLRCQGIGRECITNELSFH